MKKENEGNLKLGSNVVEMILPHRRPFLMVDAIDSFENETVPELWAKRHISANEEVFNGHFPDLHIWPGVYTQEGLGQSCNLLLVLVEVQKAWKQQGGDPEDVLNALRNIELGFQLHPGYKPDIEEKLLSFLTRPRTHLGISSSANIKFSHPVFAGQCLHYRVSITHMFDDQCRFEVEALVEGKSAARGFLTSFQGYRFLRNHTQE